MGEVTVYATKVTEVPTKIWVENFETKYEFDRDHTRTPTDIAVLHTVVDGPNSTGEDGIIVPVINGKFIRATFDLNNAPEMAGMGIYIEQCKGPFLYITSKYIQLTANGTPIPCGGRYSGDWPDARFRDTFASEDEFPGLLVGQYNNIRPLNDSLWLEINKPLEKNGAILCHFSYEFLGNFVNYAYYHGSYDIQFESSGAEHRPYLILSTVPVIPYADNPGLSHTDASQPIDVSWTFEGHVERDGYLIPGITKQTEARIRWRPKGAVGYTEYRLSTDLEYEQSMSYTIPANTLTASVIEWQISLTTNGGYKSEDEVWRESAILNPVITPSGLTPKGQIINGAIGNTFAWRTPNVDAAAVAAHEAQYSSDNGVTWRALSSAATSQASFAAPADTFPVGTYRWRVRCRNRAGVWGPWSAPAVFLVQGDLLSPVVTRVDPKPRPVVAWMSSGQQAWELDMLDETGRVLYATGAVYGGAQEHQVPEYLPPGPVTARVRVANIFGFWSEWGVKQAVIENRQGPAITLATRKVELGAELSWRTEGEYVKYLIYRDGAPIAQTAAAGYTDYRAVGKHQYFVRGVTADGYYTDSPRVYEITQVRDAAIADVRDLEWVTLSVSRGSPPAHDTQREQQVSFVHYDGRVKPVAEAAEFRDAVHTLTFTAESREQLRRLEDLMGHTVIYKSCYGDLIIGYLHQESIGRDWAADLSLTITETDYKEWYGDA